MPPHSIRRKVKYFYAALFVFVIWTIGYTVPRTDIFPFLLLFSIAFSLYLFIFKNVNNHHDFLFFIGAGLLARAGLILAWPGLSDDLYRFFWDGVISNQGLSPYAMTPDELREKSHLISRYLVEDIYPNLNSVAYYSVYPPLAQKFYQTATFFTSDNIYHSAILMRIFIIAADAGIIYLLLKLLPALRFQQKNALLYALNPLIILEFTGNLHPDVIMLFFFLLAFWWILKEKWLLFSLFFAAAVLSKLTVLLLLPLFIRRLGLRKFILSTLIIATICLISYGLLGIFTYPDHYISSLRLYFQSFEFNASFYYFFRWIGYHLTGYNMIYWIGPALMVVASGAFLFLYILQYLNDKGILIRALFLFTIFLFASTTVHPWYLLFPLVFSLFSHYRYPVVWSFLIIFSYLSYTSEPYEEWMWLVFLEYMILGFFLLIDFRILPSRRYFDFFEI